MNLKTQAAEYMLAHRDQFSVLAATPKGEAGFAFDLDAYVAAFVLADAAWAEGPAIEAVAQVVNRPIVVFIAGSASTILFQGGAGPEGDTSNPVCVLFSNSDHYDALLPKYDVCT